MGSLREALFLTVWLRRQEAELHKARILAQGLAQMAEDKEIMTIYVALSETIFPFLKGHKGQTDQKMLDQMKKEVSKGVVSFSEVSMAPLKSRAKTLALPDDFKAKLREKRTNKP